MNTQELITAICAMVLAAVVLLSPVACTANRHNQIARAIEAGADPIEAKCAIEGDNGQNTICVLAAANRKGAKP